MVLGTRYKLQDAQLLNLIIDNHYVKHVSQQKLLGLHIDDKLSFTKVSNDAKIRNRYNQVPHLTQDTNGKVTNSQKTP